MLPIVVGVPAIRRLPRPLLGVVLAYVVMVLANWAMMWLRHQNNLWLIHAYTPLRAVLLLWAYAYWQQSALERLTIWLAIPAFLAVYAALLVLAEDITRFSHYGQPIEGILLIAVAAWTMVRGIRAATVPVSRQPWFWCALGTVLLFSTTVLMGPIGNLLVGHAEMVLRIVFSIKAVLDTLAASLFTYGIVCWWRWGQTGYAPGMAPGGAAFATGQEGR